MESMFSPNQEILFLLANQVAEALAGSVAIEDLGRNVLAYSTVEDQLIDEVRAIGILMRKVPDNPENDRQYREVLTSHTEVRFPPSDNELGRIAVAITSGPVPLGTLWVIDRHPEQPLPNHQREILHQAAAQAAPVLLNREHRMTARDLPRKRILLRLLTGHLDTELREALTHTDFPHSGVLVAVQPQTPVDLTEWQRLIRATSTSLAHTAPSAIAAETELGGTNALLYIFMPVTGPAQSQIAIEQLISVTERAGNGSLRFLVVSKFVNVDELSDAHEYARAFLRIKPASPRVHMIIELADHHSDIVSDELTRAVIARPWLLSTSIMMFIEQFPDAAFTVLVWCEELGNVARAAKRLHVHENTVRFRVEKARNKYGIPLATLDDLMAFVTQYRSRN